MAIHDFQDQLEWSKAIETGHQSIDAEHGRMFEMLKQLRVMSEEGCPSDVSISDVFEQLREYSILHFANEELIMDSFNYDGNAIHKQIHATFLEKFTELQSGGAINEENAIAYVTFIYDWLVSHICTVDQVMVSQMRNTDQGYRSSLTNQTDLIISTSMNVANYLSSMTSRLNAAQNPDDRSRIKAEIDSASERLLNLVSLADSRVDLWGGSEFHCQRMTQIKATIAKSACNLMEQYAVKVINYGGRILSGKSGVPMGCGAIIHNLITAINTIAGLIGTNDVLTVAQSSVVIRAVDVANEVSEVIAHHFAKSKFNHVIDVNAGGGGRRYTVPESVAARAARHVDMFKSTKSDDRVSVAAGGES